jgi:hypothetical protein
MGSSILGSIAYAEKTTGDAYFAQRYEDTLKWTLTVYLHYDGDYDWGKKGLINERFCYTDSLLAERYPDGSPSSTWFCAHSWLPGQSWKADGNNVMDKKFYREVYTMRQGVFISGGLMSWQIVQQVDGAADLELTGEYAVEEFPGGEGVKVFARIVAEDTVKLFFNGSLRYFGKLPVEGCNKKECRQVVCIG